MKEPTDIPGASTQRQAVPPAGNPPVRQAVQPGTNPIQPAQGQSLRTPANYPGAPQGGQQGVFKVTQTLSKKLRPTPPAGGVNIGAPALAPGKKYRITCLQGGSWTDIAPPMWDPNLQVYNPNQINQDGTLGGWSLGGWVEASWTFSGPGSSKETDNFNIAKHYSNLEKRHVDIDKKTKSIHISRAYVNRFLVEVLELEKVA